MKLHLRWGDDPESVAWCGLVWEHAGSCYPHAEHRDFAVDVLGQWSVAMRELLRGAEQVTLRYLEGGHALAITRTGDDCVVQPTDVAPPVTWTATVRELATAVQTTAAHVAGRLPESADLARDAELLREALERPAP